MKIKFEGLNYPEPSFVTIAEDGSLQSDGTILADMFVGDWDGTPEGFMEYYKMWVGGYYASNLVPDVSAE
jgi:uncharacterized Rossmann fold enzyme